jgi:hypothetical protein
MDAPLDKSHDKNIFILAGFLLICVLALGIVNLIVNSFNKNQPAKPTQNTIKRQAADNIPVKQTTQTVENKTLPPPEMKFNAYKLETQLPSVPDKLTAYKLKNNYSLEEATQFASKFGLSNPTISDDKRYVTFANLTDQDKRGILNFDLATGRFIFDSYGNHKPAITLPNQSPLLTASLFITSLGFDNTISCTDSYQKRDQSDKVYVECHRDWAKVGLPIFNTLGLLNVRDSERLADLRLGKPDLQAPTDTSIIDTNNNTDSKVRSNDFNTITLSISQSTQRIIHIDSNLRQIENTTDIGTPDIVPPSSIVSSLQNNRALFSLSLPTGQGYTPWERIYANNQAIANTASIKDVVLSYVENPEGLTQDYLVPVYVIKGTAQLTTGYNIQYIKILSATQKQFSFLPYSPEVAGISTLAQYNDRTPKQGTFDIETPAPTAAALTPTSPPVSDVTPPPACTSSTGTELALNIPGMGTINVTYPQDNAFKSREISIKSSSFPYKDMDTLRELFFAGTGEEPGPIGQQYIISVARLLTNSSPVYRIPSVTPPQTVDDAKRLFITINKTIGPGGYGRMQVPKEFCGASFGFAWMAPPVTEDKQGCPSLQKNNFYEQTEKNLISPMTNKVAVKIVEAVKNNTLKALSDQPDIFPADITGSFQQILYAPYGLDNDPIYGTNNRALFSCRITGSSPKLFVYNIDKTQISVHAPVTYADPPLINNTWNVTGNTSLYYEYDSSKVRLQPSSYGYVLAAQTWENFMKNTLSPQLTLNAQETNTLIADIKNELWKVKNQYKYVVLTQVTEETLNTHLPLTLHPIPQTFHRVHFIVTPTNIKETMEAPQLHPITRNGYTIIEVGATLK